MVNTAVGTEVLEEKMPESPWHNKMVEIVKEPLEEAFRLHPTAVVFRDLFFEFRGKKHAPDIAVVLKGAPPMENIGLVYRVPEDGPAPDAVVEVAVSPKAFGEALTEKAGFYAEMGVKDYLVLEAFAGKDVRLWASNPPSGERPKPVSEAMLESLGILVRAEGLRVRMFDREGKEIPPLRDLVTSLREALEQSIKALEQSTKALEQERAKREELQRQLAELQRLFREKEEGR